MSSFALWNLSAQLLLSWHAEHDLLWERVYARRLTRPADLPDTGTRVVPSLRCCPDRCVSQ